MANATMPQDTMGRSIQILGSLEGTTLSVASAVASSTATAATSRLTIGSGAWVTVPSVGSIITVSGFTTNLQNNGGHYVTAATTTTIDVASVLVDETATITILLWPEGQTHGAITLPSGAATYIKGLRGGEIYELSVTLDADKIDGIPDNVYVRPGGVITSKPVTTASFLWQVGVERMRKFALLPDQHSIGLLSTNNVTLYVSWRRLV